MDFEPQNQQRPHNDKSLTAVRSGLSSLWIGSDNNIESTFLNGADGKLQQLWVSALSESGKERFVYCNQDSRNIDSFMTLPTSVAEQVSHLYEPIKMGSRSLTDSMPDLLRVMEPAIVDGFWTEGVGPDMFALPAGLKTRRAVSLLPSFEEFCENPTLGRNLFAVGAETLDIGIFISEKENFSLIAFKDSVFKVPGDSLTNGTLRDFTFTHASLLVDGSLEEFFRGVGQFRVKQSWEQAGGPSVMLASKRNEGAELRTFDV